ncbi:MAG TPA: DUF58 domain-containing protein [Acidobacteriaceae bacterium]|jgi:uncharacterized protein (DUF58 family)|nr:DUF58 domain-containing protein [Acidobacteriaceae bacterium]
MIQTLVPAPAAVEAQPRGRFGRLLGTTLTARALLLLAAGLLWAIPGFFGRHWLPFMVGWDALVAALVVVEAISLPPASAFRVTRTFLDSPVLGEETHLEIEILHAAAGPLQIHVADDLHPALAQLPPGGRVLAFPRDPARIAFTVIPNRRGDFALGGIWLRCRGSLRLVERRAMARPAQRVRVYPAMERAQDNAALYLLRLRQIAIQRRRLRIAGTGREFDHLRDYRSGDEMRNISWPATARRAHVVTREFTTERSQQVWIVLDAGRLSGTAFELRRTHAGAAPPGSFHDAAADESYLLSLTQLDQACGAGVALAQTVMQAGDKAGLLVYGRGMQQQILPAAGAGHLRTIIDALSMARNEGSEADHLRAAALLGHLQRRRSLVLWITEIADSARRPDVAEAALDLARRHLVLLVVLGHEEIRAVAARPPANAAQMFESAAAQEVLERRRHTLAGLRAKGVLVVETTPGALRTDAINEYLEVKARGLL